MGFDALQIHTSEFVMKNVLDREKEWNNIYKDAMRKTWGHISTKNKEQQQKQREFVQKQAEIRVYETRPQR